MRLRLTAAALRDLTEIGDFIAQDNPRRAVTFVRELREACRKLLEAPYRFAMLEGDETKQFRRRVYGQYLIIYRIAQDQVVVARVISAAIDLTGLALPLD